MIYLLYTILFGGNAHLPLRVLYHFPSALVVALTPARSSLAPPSTNVVSSIPTGLPPVGVPISATCPILPSNVPGQTGPVAILSPLPHGATAPQIGAGLVHVGQPSGHNHPVSSPGGLLLTGMSQHHSAQLPMSAPVASASALQAPVATLQLAPTPQIALQRSPSPLFIPVPPRTSRVLHSEIYQR
ncbi:unnamed protein product [Protopolystoma xenopodis]|uniref:Uncharacterized protein n=1 Tax=Protopolystoma xenopodis TaxID=117903 RepID=A0A3S4ZKT1_9PLAT|nr:unnamed protein product [Protopolystoma xenopodis]